LTKLYTKLKRYIRYILFSKLESNLFSTVSHSVSNSDIVFEIEGSFNGKLLIGTGSGLLLINRCKIKRLFGGQSYGITKSKNKFLVHQDMVHFSRIISIENNFDNIDDKISYSILSTLNTTKIHQIDYYDKHLYICDTINNRIIIYNLATERFKYFYPNGKLYDGSDSSNYMHINSVFINDEKINILAHNKTTKSNKPSQIWTYNNKNMEFINKVDIGVNCHNIVIHKGDLYYCDSMNGTLVKNNDIVFSNSDYFTRGLAITDDYIFLGGSEFAERKKRFKANGVLYVLDHYFKEVASFKMNGIGSLHEIRSLDGDYGLSQNFES